MQNEMKERDKIIDEYAKIIDGTKKEYQKLYAENVKYREKIKHRQEFYQKIKEKKLYETRRRQFVKQPRRMETKPRRMGTKKTRYYLESESEPEDYYGYAFDETDGRPPKKRTKTTDRHNSPEEESEETEEEEEEGEKTEVKPIIKKQTKNKQKTIKHHRIKNKKT